MPYRAHAYPIGVPGKTTKDSLARVHIQATNNANATYNFYAFGRLIAVGLTGGQVVEVLTDRKRVQKGRYRPIIEREPERRVRLESLGEHIAIVDDETGERLVSFMYSPSVGRRLRQFVACHNLDLVNPSPCFFS